MTHELILRKEATWDLSDIEDYYNKIRPSLADQFFEELFRRWTISKMNRNYIKLGIEG